MTRTQRYGLTTAVVVAATSMAIVRAQNQPKPNAQEQEREVKESEVPKAALDALKKMADKSPIKEFAEEIEHGLKYYEGSWVGPHGNVEGLVTEAGDTVELEEKVPAEMIPMAVRNAASKDAGKDTKMFWEKKTVIMYEVHFRKDGKGHELMFTPDGRPYHEQGGPDGGDNDDD